MLEASLESYARLQTGCRRDAACAATQIRHAQIMAVSGMTDRKQSVDSSRELLLAIKYLYSSRWGPVFGT